MPRLPAGLPSMRRTLTTNRPGYALLLVLPPDQIMDIDNEYRQRLRSLLAIDELIAALVDTLQASGTLENTYILLTSDNGSFAGEHRLRSGKQAPYEEAIRVPLVVRGPGVPAGQVMQQLSLNIDLAPTIAEMAGGAVPDFVDGRSLMPQLHGEQTTSSRHAFLLELFAPITRARPTSAAEVSDEGSKPTRAVTPYRALRTADATYVEYETGERELYDLQADPYQLNNLAGKADAARVTGLSTRLAQLAGCSGASCRVIEDTPLDAFESP